MKVPRSVLPKALRRGGARPLRLTWPALPVRGPRKRLSKREWASLQRREHERLLRLVRRAKKAARAAR
jgi:hypothetical protein